MSRDTVAYFFKAFTWIRSTSSPVALCSSTQRFIVKLVLPFSPLNLVTTSEILKPPSRAEPIRHLHQLAGYPPYPVGELLARTWHEVVPVLYRLDSCPSLGGSWYLQVGFYHINAVKLLYPVTIYMYCYRQQPRQLQTCKQPIFNPNLTNFLKNKPYIIKRDGAIQTSCGTILRLEFRTTGTRVYSTPSCRLIPVWYCISMVNSSAVRSPCFFLTSSRTSLILPAAILVYPRRFSLYLVNTSSGSLHLNQSS